MNQCLISIRFFLFFSAMIILCDYELHMICLSEQFCISLIDILICAMYWNCKFLFHPDYFLSECANFLHCLLTCLCLHLVNLVAWSGWRRLE
uniref:Uncharacterized protein n=1 Tax=Rhizophora mucronata TaxID=61149 RepID=A0A2P2MYG7_RHIMU